MTESAKSDRIPGPARPGWTAPRLVLLSGTAGAAGGAINITESSGLPSGNHS